MSSGDPIKAGRITTSFSTTDLVAERDSDGYHTSEFAGPAILRVGPSNNVQDNRVSDATFDGIQGAGSLGGTGLVGIGGPFVQGLT